jgi:formylglycine-generating enzyme required for sulfatase activity
MDLAAMSLQAKIAAQIDEEIQARLAWELLRLELDHWRETGSLIHPHILALIHQRREALRRLAKDEAELLFRSALAAGYGIAEWVERAFVAGVPVGVISLEELQRDNFRMRAAAVSALGPLGDLQGQDGQFVRSIIEMLVDDYPQVRVAAIRALERLRPEGEWRKHLVYECYVPAGEFVMGDDGTDLRGKKVPAHDVLVDAFYIGKYPVTNADYQRYVDDVGHEFELPEGKTAHPVVDISWHQARDYAAWAGMRLLTEAEWEKAASWTPVTGREKGDLGAERPTDKVTYLRRQAGRQKDTGRWPRFVKRLIRRKGGGQEMEGQEDKVIERRKQVYPWGNEFDPSQCNTGEARLDHTTPVGIYSPEGDSPYGCADMVGNVWEWTSSLYRDYAYQADDGREDMSLSGYRVVRGGSFFSYQGVARSAGRFGLDPYFCNLYRGFRVGLSANLPLL